MVGLPYDFVANPLGAVRLSFEKSISDSPTELDPVVAFRGKDWGAVDLFRDFLFDKGGLSQVPLLDASTLRSIQPNTLVRFRGMVQDMLGNELYIGAFKDGSTWRTNKFTDVTTFSMPPSFETQLWERHLFHCVPVPGQNSWTLEPSSTIATRDLSILTSPQGEKRRRDSDEVDLNVSDERNMNTSSGTKKQKEDGVDNSACSSDDMVITSDNVSEQVNGIQNAESSSFSCIVKVYDMPENNLKLNDVLEFVGVYTFDPVLVVHKDESDDPMYDLLEDPIAQLPPSKVPRLHCFLCTKLEAHNFLSNSQLVEPLPNVIRGIRESLLAYLTATLGNDSVAAQYLLLHLLSRLRARVDMVAVGKLSLNLTGFTKESVSIFGRQLTNSIQNLMPFSQVIPLSIEFLNTATLQPRKDNKTGRLVTGALQLAQGTHLTIDETSLQTGTLNAKGVENARLLKHLTEFQMVEYDFEYYKLEMATDVQLLVLSDGKSNILPADLVLPFAPSGVVPVNATPEELHAWRWYLATMKSLPHTATPEIHQTLQDDMVAAMQEDRSLGCSELSRWLTMGEVVAMSFGENKLSLESWQMVKELEKLRKERLKH